MMLTHDQYFKYAELTDVLHQFAKQFPSLVKLESIGETEQGRKIWIATITDFSTGDHSEKPGFWVDGNTHASELAGCQACLHLIDTLTSKKDETRIAELLKRTTFYVIPRISADGAEHVLEKKSFVRSTSEIYPGDNPKENFEVKDLDGDGEVLQMRVQDPAGDYKISKRDPRLMIPRAPTDFLESDGPFYTLLQEGEFKNYDGFRRQHVDQQRFDLNRQAPVLFSPKEYGAGPLPMYLKEAQALARAFVARPNIVGAHTHHTFGGFLLRPSSLRPDTEFPTMDLEVYKAMGEIGEKILGYKAVAVFHDFKYDPKTLTTGAWDDWHYDHRGVYSWTPEIWSLPGQVGITYEKPLEAYQTTKEDDHVKIIAWCDQNLPAGSYFKDWKTFQHSQLGKVEIGGWRRIFVWSNPPTKFLKAELEKLTEFSLMQAQMSPCVRLKEVKVKKIETGIFSLKISLQNTGFLPTYVSQNAKSLSVYKSPTAHLKLATGQTVVEGKDEISIKHLSGRAESLPWVSALWGSEVGNSHEDQYSWIVQGSGEVEFEARFGMGGTVKTKVKLS